MLDVSEKFFSLVSFRSLSAQGQCGYTLMCGVPRDGLI